MIVFWVFAALVCAFLFWALVLLPVWRTGREFVRGFRGRP